MMRVLMICPELPSDERPGSMAPGARQIQSIADSGIDVEIVDMRGIAKLKYLQLLPRVVTAMGKVDLIHAHFGFCGWMGLLGRQLAFGSIPIVISFMGDDLLGTPIDQAGNLQRSSLWAANINRRLAKSYDQVIVKSSEMADRLAPLECHVIPNGVDLKRFSPENRVEARQRLKWSPDGLKVLFPGDPNNPRKGFGLAQETVRIAQAKLEQPIDLVPLWNVPPDSVVDYMNATNAMLMTSLIEGSPNVVKEALACNSNIVGVSVGDVSEMLKGIDGCFNIASRDPEELGCALAELLVQEGYSNGRQAIIDRQLSLESIARRILDVYELALSRQTLNT